MFIDITETMKKKNTHTNSQIPSLVTLLSQTKSTRQKLKHGETKNYIGKIRKKKKKTFKSNPLVIYLFNIVFNLLKTA